MKLPAGAVSAIEADASVYGRWTLVGKRADVLAVGRGTVVEHIPTALRISLERALDGFCRPQVDPDYARGGWEIEFATDAAREAASRVRVRDVITGAEISLDTMVACLGRTLHARAFVKSDLATILLKPANEPRGPSATGSPAEAALPGVHGDIESRLKIGPKPVVVRDIGLTKEVSAKDLVHAKGISKSQATKYLRIIVGRRAGTGETLRAPVGEVERYFAAGCPATWNRSTWRAGR